MSTLRTLLIGVALAGLCAEPALAADTAGVRVEHAAARVVVIAENRADYAISIDQGRAGLKPLTVHRNGDVTVVDGGYGANFGLFHMGWDNLNCRGGWDRNPRVAVPDKGEVALSDLPVVTIHAPLDARIAGSGAVYGEINPTRSLDFANAGCGDWRIADVRGPLSIALSGSGDMRAGASGDAHIAISGSSDVVLGSVNGRLESRISGSGDIHAAAAHGPISARIAGSGDVVIDGGDAPEVHVAIAGSGDFRFRGTAGAVNASVAGSGDVDIAHANGPVSKRVAGSGDVHIGR
jgi:hypothetical protein